MFNGFLPYIVTNVMFEIQILLYCWEIDSFTTCQHFSSEIESCTKTATHVVWVAILWGRFPYRNEWRSLASVPIYLVWQCSTGQILSSYWSHITSVTDVFPMHFPWNISLVDNLAFSCLLCVSILGSMRVSLFNVTLIDCVSLVLYWNFGILQQWLWVMWKDWRYKGWCMWMNILHVIWPYLCHARRNVVSQVIKVT